MGEDLHKATVGKIFEFARNLRKRDTPAEKKLWPYLRNRRLEGFKFRRQHPIQNYIADFYCHDAKLIIEVDGEIHLNTDQTIYDQSRTYQLGFDGIKVIRFKNEEIEKDIDSVLEAIKDQLGGPPPN